jgi:uridine kinase
MINLIGIAGGSGSGKTTFADKLTKLTKDGVTVIHMDSYYLPKQPKDNISESGKTNFDHPRAFDWALVRDHLEKLKNGEDIECPIYDFNTSSRTNKTTKIKSAPVIVFEGIFALFDQDIRDLLDIRVFLHVDSDIRFTRRLNRDVKERGRDLESIISQYYDTVRPMYLKFLEPQKQYADFIVGEETDIAADILSAKINELNNTKQSDQEDILPLHH